jgi:hypothetical protein
MEAGSTASTSQVGPQEEVESWGPVPLGENLYSASLPIGVAIHGVASASQPGINSASQSLSTTTSESSNLGSQTTGNAMIHCADTLEYQNALFLAHVQGAQSAVSSQSIAHPASTSVSTARSRLSYPTSRSYAVYSGDSSCSQMYSADGATIESDTSLALADQNSLFLSNMQQTTRSLSDSMSVPSIEPVIVRDQRRAPSASLQHSSRPSNAANNGTTAYSDFSGGESGSRLNSNTTTTTATNTFPTVTPSSRNSTAQRIGRYQSYCATYDDSSGVDATSIVSIPSEVLPHPTTLENTISGLTTAMPMRFMAHPFQSAPGDSHSYDDHDDDDDDLSRNVAMPTTELRSRITTSSSLTTISTTMANHAFHYEHNRSLLDVAIGGAEGGGHHSSSTGSSSSITIHSIQRQYQNTATNIDDTLAAAVIQADEDAKLKAASEFIPPPPAAVASCPRSPRGETLVELEDIILAKRGASSEGPPPRRAQFLGTQQSLLEEKLAGTPSPSELAFDPNRLLQGNNILPVVQEQSVLEELDALNRSFSQEDRDSVARRRATFVRPGAYHQAPGQVAIRRVRSRADSLQGGTVDGSTTSGTTTSLLRRTSNATNVSEVSSIGIASHNYQNSDGMSNAIDLPGPQTRRRTYSGGSIGSGYSPEHNAVYDDLSFVNSERLVSSTSSSAFASSALPIGAPTMSRSMSASSSAEANQSQSQSSNSSLAASSTLLSANHGHRSHSDAGTSTLRQENRPRDEGDEEDSFNSGLVEAHPVQPSAAIVNADPVFPLDRTRRRGLVEEGVDMPQTIKLPFSRSSSLLAVLTCFVLLLGAVVAVVMLVTIGRNDSSTTMIDNGFSTASNGTFVPTTQRGRLIQQRLESEFGILEELKRDDAPKKISPGSSRPSSLSPYSKAMHWLVNIDPVALDPSADNLLQRYLMAYFYFHTSEERPWVSCNPATGQEDRFCSYRYVKPFGEVYDESLYNIRWLSNDHECDWAGVYCENFTIIELSLSKCCSPFWRT